MIRNNRAMKPAHFAALIALLLFCACGAHAQGFQPPHGYVPDAKTAIRIAVAILSPIYGEKQIQGEKPFRAALKHGVWTVNGSLPNAHTAGGTAMAAIAQKDGRILFVMHGK